MFYATQWYFPSFYGTFWASRQDIGVTVIMDRDEYYSLHLTPICGTVIEGLSKEEAFTHAPILSTIMKEADSPLSSVRDAVRMQVAQYVHDHFYVELPESMLTSSEVYGVKPTAHSAHAFGSAYDLFAGSFGQSALDIHKALKP